MYKRTSPLVLRIKKMKQNKNKLPMCKCGHDAMEHCPSVVGYHHCKHYGCKCEKFEREKK